jgi:hypothetical protein
MDETLQRIGFLLFDTFLPLVIGYFLNRTGLVTQRGTKRLMVFNVRVIFTILALVSFWKLKINLSVVWVLVIGVLFTFLPYFVVKAWGDRKNIPPLEKGALVTAGMLGNTGTLGGLVSYLLMGPMAYACVQLVAVAQNVILILFNFPVAQHYRDLADPANAKPKESVLKFFISHFFTWNQISLIGMIAGIYLSVTGVPQPEAFTKAFGPLVHISSWINFMPVGLLLNFSAIRKFFRMVLITVPVKFVLTPLFVWVLGLLFIPDPIQRATLVIIAATPTAINSVITSELYGLNTNVAIASFCVTTVIFLLVVCPILIFALPYI